MKKDLVVETIWLNVVVVVSIVACVLLFGLNNLLKGFVEIQVYDTYYIASTLLLIGQVFFPFAFFTFGYRTTKHKFNKTSTNLIFIVVTSGLIIMTTLVINQVSKLGLIYPPLCSIPLEQSLKENETIATVMNVLTIVQALLLMVLVFTSIMTGKNIKKHIT